MSVQQAEMIKNARKPFEYNYAEGDNVLIVSDTGMDPAVWAALNNAARSMDIPSVVLIMPKPEFSYVEPPRLVRESILESDLCLFATSKGLAHSPTVKEARARGQKLIWLSESEPETLAGSAAAADYDEIRRRGRIIAEKMDNGEQMEITTELGTNLTVSIEGRRGIPVSGSVEERWDVNACAFPDGEVAIAPLEGTANGTLVWDISMHELGRLDNPIEAIVEDGNVVELKGKQEANKLREMLEAVDAPGAYNIAEIAIGINPGAGVTGRLREDKKADGFLHIAVGGNSDFGGGQVDVDIHLDGVFGGATVKIDTETVVKGGTVVV